LLNVTAVGEMVTPAGAVASHAPEVLPLVTDASDALVPSDASGNTATTVPLASDQVRLKPKSVNKVDVNEPDPPGNSLIPPPVNVTLALPPLLELEELLVLEVDEVLLVLEVDELLLVLDELLLDELETNVSFVETLCIAPRSSVTV
jgi:hypothetical protein